MSKRKPIFPPENLLLDGTINIVDEQRDHQLAKRNKLNESHSWTRVIRIFSDQNHLDQETSGNSDQGPRGELEEHVLLWPSAPIYELGAPRGHAIPDERHSTWHTFRLLKRPGVEEIDRVYLFFNGLNEWRTFQTYYRLADLLFLNEERRRRRKESHLQGATSACIIRPFPGHLTRHPFSSNFFKLPMAHYLEDAAELYRQFLRYMVETQWLLSAVVPFNDVPLKTGLDLLARNARSEPRNVAKAIALAWRTLENADKVAGGQRNDGQPNHQLDPPDCNLLIEQVERLRKLVSWKMARDGWPESDSIATRSFRPLSFHAVGYSMGGFVAQATMFTWPQVFATCTMLASGGSLSDVQASFVHEDEWIHVLDRLLPDLENPAIVHQIPVEFDHDNSQEAPTTIYGLPRGYYSAFRRAFDQIFLQRSMRRREYRDWLDEFHERLLFILGGRDPVVKVSSVVESAPPSGLNTIEIAGLKHELHDRRHRDWQKFWFPRVVARTIEDFVRRREKGHYHRLKERWNPEAALSRPGDERTPSEPTGKELASHKLRELSLDQLEDALVRSIKWMETVGSAEIGNSRIAPVEYKPFVVVARNRVPVELFPDSFLDKYGIVHHYSEERVAEAEERRRHRRKLLAGLGTRFRMILPDAFPEIEARAVGGPLAQWPDATGGRDWSPNDTRRICEDLRKQWATVLQPWTPSRETADTLPDCWYFFAMGWMIQWSVKEVAGWPVVHRAVARALTSLRSIRRTGADPTPKDEAAELYRRALDGVRIYRVSPAHSGTRYAGHEILDVEEKRVALDHLLTVLGKPADM